MGMRFWVLICLAASLVSTDTAIEVQAKHARVEFLSQHTGLRIGQENLLGIHFALEQGWHIYWINPGDSGQPPVFQWQLPDGFSAGPVQWPRPEKLQSAHLADYGYKDDVMLLVPVRAPAFYHQADAKLVLQAKWLICREVCLPDHAQLEITLPYGAPADQHQEKLFAETKRLLPERWPRTWKITALSQKEDFVLSLQTGRSITKAEFFPLEPNQIENAAPQAAKPTPLGANITLKKSDQLLKPVSTLKGVLEVEGKTYQVEAPVTQR